MTKNKTAVPATDTTANHLKERLNYTTSEAAKSGHSVGKAIAMQTQRATIGWSHLPLNWSHRNLRRLQAKRKKMGRENSAPLLVAGISTEVTK